MGDAEPQALPRAGNQAVAQALREMSELLDAQHDNPARAHELDRVHDWVVIYAEDRDHGQRQYTLVTPARGVLVGQRVVRGREAACRDGYARVETARAMRS